MSTSDFPVRPSGRDIHPVEIVRPVGSCPSSLLGVQGGSAGCQAGGGRCQAVAGGCPGSRIGVGSGWVGGV